MPKKSKTRRSRGKKQPAVIVQQTVQLRKKRRSPRPRGATPRSPKSLFARVIADPFNPDNNGARVPDSYNFPTTTGHCHYEAQLTTSSSGVSSSVFYPSPLLAASLKAGNITTGLSAFSSNTSDYYFTSRSTLNSTFESYRVVAFGVKISNLQPELSATGRVIVTPLPINGPPIGYDFYNGATAALNFLTQNTVGLTVAQLSSSQMLTMPQSIEIPVQDLLHGDVEFHMIPTNKIFYKFKNLNSQAFSSTQNMVESGEALYATSTGTIAGGVAEAQDNMNMDGGVALNVTLLGGPNSSVALQIEVIVYVEGIPVVNSAVPTLTLTSPMVEAGCDSQVDAGLMEGRTTGFMKFLDRASTFLTQPLRDPRAAERMWNTARVLSATGGATRNLRAARITYS
jgi:hypothetical protein